MRRNIRLPGLREKVAHAMHSPPPDRRRLLMPQRSTRAWENVFLRLLIAAGILSYILTHTTR